LGSSLFFLGHMTTQIAKRSLGFFKISFHSLNILDFKYENNCFSYSELLSTLLSDWLLLPDWFSFFYLPYEQFFNRRLRIVGNDQKYNVEFDKKFLRRKLKTIRNFHKHNVDLYQITKIFRSKSLWLMHFRKTTSLMVNYWVFLKTF
jgi:hypothetical protein